MMDFEHEIAQIKSRNQKVEAEKAWETSTFRKVSIAFLTYFVCIIFFVVAENERPFLNALVPTLAFGLSTLSLSWIKKWWLRNKSKF